MPPARSGPGSPRPPAPPAAPAVASGRAIGRAGPFLAGRVALSADLGLAAAVVDEEVRIIDLRSMAVVGLRSLAGAGSPAVGIAVDPAGARVAIALSDGRFAVVDVFAPPTAIAGA